MYIYWRQHHTNTDQFENDMEILAEHQDILQEISGCLAIIQGALHRLATNQGLMACHQGPVPGSDHQLLKASCPRLRIESSDPYMAGALTSATQRKRRIHAENIRTLLNPVRFDRTDNCRQPSIQAVYGQQYVVTVYPSKFSRSLYHGGPGCILISMSLYLATVVLLTVFLAVNSYQLAGDSVLDLETRASSTCGPSAGNAVCASGLCCGPNVCPTQE